MRELVYLSQRKLSQFQPERPRGGRFLSRITGVGAKAPLSMGEVSLTLAASTTQSVLQLDKVLDELNNRVRGVQWYEDANIRVGDWAQFEALMNYAVVEEPGLPDAPLLFWEPRPNNPGDAPTGPSLLLHASSDGLVGSPAGVSGGISNSMSDPTALSKALRQLRHSDDPLSKQSNLSDWEWLYVLDSIRQRLDYDYPPFMASWIAGYARITGILPANKRSRLRAGHRLGGPLAHPYPAIALLGSG